MHFMSHQLPEKQSLYMVVYNEWLCQQSTRNRPLKTTTTLTWSAELEAVKEVIGRADANRRDEIFGLTAEGVRGFDLVKHGKCQH